MGLYGNFSNRCYNPAQRNDLLAYFCCKFSSDFDGTHEMQKPFQKPTYCILE